MIRTLSRNTAKILFYSISFGIVGILLSSCNSFYALVADPLNEKGSSPAPYEINLQPPQLKIHDQVGSQINDIIASVFHQEAAAFKTDLAALAHSESKDCLATLQGKTKVGIDDSRIVSIRLDISRYLCTTPHPETSVQVVTFVRRSGKEVWPRDLFPSTPLFLNELSRLSREALATVDQKASDGSERQWLDEGTAPLSKNFDNLLVSPSGIHIIFEPYQIESFTHGAREIVLPYEQLRSIITPESPLFFYREPSATEKN